MSEDPIEAINQVVDCIDEGCQFGNEHVCGGWLRDASKNDILEWVYGHLRGRVINALERTKEALAKPRRNCDRFDSGDPDKDAEAALHAYVHDGVAGFRSVARYLLSPVGKEKVNRDAYGLKERLHDSFRKFCESRVWCDDCPIASLPGPGGCREKWMGMLVKEK